MTRVAYFDAPAGISGDMTLGAFLHAGLSLDDLARGLVPLALPGYVLRAEPASQYGITGTHLTVDVAPGQPQRDWRAIRALIADSGLTDRAKEAALRIFGALAAAEAAVHGVAVDDVHFHEVGAVDSIVDIVGTAVALGLLGIEAVYGSPFAQGSGWTQSQHGRIPIPAPATLALIAAARAPTVPLDTDKETVTPTGAAIVTALAAGYDRPAMRVERVGYGFGTRPMPWPNCLRVWIGEAGREQGAGDREQQAAVRLDAPFSDPLPHASRPLSSEYLLAANIDDMTPEALAFALERLFAAGALDAWFVPITMKKSRPAVQVAVICRAEERAAITATLLTQTSTFGVRAVPLDRAKAERHWERVETQWGPVRVKIKTWEGVALDAVPEYEQVAALARAAGVPFRTVYAAAAAAGRRFVGAPPVEVLE